MTTTAELIFNNHSWGELAAIGWDIQLFVKRNADIAKMSVVYQRSGAGMQIAMRLTKWAFRPGNTAIWQGWRRPSISGFGLSDLTLCRCIGILKPESVEEAMYRDLSALPQHGHARRRFKPQNAAKPDDATR